MYCAYFCVFEDEGVGLRYYTHLGLHQGGVEGPVRHVFEMIVAPSVSCIKVFTISFTNIRCLI